MKPKPMVGKSASFPEIHARVYTYSELIQMCDDYISIDYWRSIVLSMNVYRTINEIDLYFDGDIRKAKYWSPSLSWCDIKLIVDEYPLKNVVFEKAPAVAQLVVDELKDFFTRHIN